MKDVTVEKAESLVDQIQEVRDGAGEEGTLQRTLLRQMGLCCISSFPNLDSLPCELEEAFFDCHGAVLLCHREH